jgi:dienelactone hydrolase
MATILMFHHAQGLTPGVRAFADDLRAAGHVVHTPDLYEGMTFPGLNEGVEHAKKVGFGTLLERGVQASEGLPNELVYAGFSMGCMAAQKLTQTRPGAKGALLFHSAIPLSEFGGTWPKGVPLQIHTMEGDDWGDVAEARQLAETIEGAELFLYPGDKHLFTDRSLDQYDEQAAGLVKQRVLRFLAGIRQPAAEVR